MQFENLIKLPNLTGEMEYIAEDGRVVPQEEFLQVNRDASNTGFAYKTVGATEENISNHFIELLLDQAGTDDEILAVEDKAKALTDKHFGREPVQNATPKPRMAASYDFNKELNKIMQPWAKQTETSENKGLWVGRTVEGFNEAAKDLEYKIQQMASTEEGAAEMAKQLQKDLGYGPNQARDEVTKVSRGGRLSDVFIGVPNATGDELLNLAALRGSDIDNAELWNQGDPIWATDISIGSGRDRRGVDAQRQFGEDFKIGLLQQLSGREANQMGRLFAQNQDTKISELLKIIKRDFPDAYDDKLLHTVDLGVNPAPTRRVRDFTDAIRKDYLISTDMRGWTQPRREKGIFKYHHGPYNPTAGKDINVIDLAALRQDVVDRTPKQLKDDLGGMILPSMSGRIAKLQLELPRSQVIQMTSDSILDRQIVDQINKRRNWGRR